jgi:hypothetical protein
MIWSGIVTSSACAAQWSAMSSTNAAFRDRPPSLKNSDVRLARAAAVRPWPRLGGLVVEQVAEHRRVAVHQRRFESRLADEHAESPAGRLVQTCYCEFESFAGR